MKKKGTIKKKKEKSLTSAAPSLLPLAAGLLACGDDFRERRHFRRQKIQEANHRSVPRASPATKKILFLSLL